MRTKTFLSKLKKTPDHFQSKWIACGHDQAVRILRYNDPNDFYFCPVTAVCEMETGKEFDIWDQHLAGKALGLSRKQVDNITTAADHNDESADPKLRAKILEATSPRKDPNESLY